MCWMSCPIAGTRSLERDVYVLRLDEFTAGLDHKSLVGFHSQAILCFGSRVCCNAPAGASANGVRSGVRRACWRRHGRCDSEGDRYRNQRRHRSFRKDGDDGLGGLQRSVSSAWYVYGGGGGRRIYTGVEVPDHLAGWPNRSDQFQPEGWLGQRDGDGQRG